MTYRINLDDGKYTVLYQIGKPLEVLRNDGARATYTDAVVQSEWFVALLDLAERGPSVDAALTQEPVSEWRKRQLESNANWKKNATPKQIRASESIMRRQAEQAAAATPQPAASVASGGEAVPSLDDLRSRFLAVADARGWNVDQRPVGGFVNSTTQAAWIGFRSALGRLEE